MTEKFRINTVCTGNICRSAMAESIIRRKVEEKGLSKYIETDSSGASSFEQYGYAIDDRAARTLAEYGYDTLPKHRSKRLTQDLVANRDLFIAMTSSHYRAIKKIVKEYERKYGKNRTAEVFLCREFDPEFFDPNLTESEREKRIYSGLLDIDDPWYGDMNDFEISFMQIEKSADNIVEYAEKNL